MHPYRAWPFLSDPHYPFLSAVWAVLAHGVLSLIVVLPIVLGSNRRILYGTLAFIGGPALDLDHVVAAESFSPRALEHLGHRPDTHSLIFAVVLALVALVLTRRLLAAWSAFAVIVSHLLFDAAGGDEYWLYPLKHPNSIPWLACPIGIVVLTGISSVLARAARSSPAVEDAPLPRPGMHS
jgi:membrane-bound metal-dependent hydrolase YbcI (DUF457 family)